ncbi:hypothetical protein ABZP36_029305 [Zizania latifolia]
MFTNNKSSKVDGDSLPPGFSTRPWLVQGSRGDTLIFIDVVNQSRHETIIPELRGKTCLGCLHNGEWLLMLDESTAECFLLHITSPRTKIPLPPLHEPLEFLSKCEMLGSPENSNCTVIVASSFEVEEEQYLLHCHLGADEWIKLVSPFDDISFRDIIINYNKKIYVSASNFNLIVLDMVDGKIRLQLMGTVESKDIGAQRCGRSRFVESSGDLFYLWIEELGCFGNDGPLTNIAVYCLDFEAMSWRRVESIGSDRSFLLSGLYGFSFPSMEGMLQGNCVYLVWSCCDSERLFKFCLDDMTISFCQILSQPTKPWCRAFWSVPPSIQSISVVDESTLPNNLPSTELLKINQPDGLDKHIEDGRQGNSLMPWDDLPLELIELIASNLSLVDRIRFSAVCKEFSKVSSPIEQAKVWPWLMHMSKQDGTCKLFDPLRCEEYNMQVTPFDTLMKSDTSFAPPKMVGCSYLLAMMTMTSS